MRVLTVFYILTIIICYVADYLIYKSIEKKLVAENIKLANDRCKYSSKLEYILYLIPFINLGFILLLASHKKLYYNDIKDQFYGINNTLCVWVVTLTDKAEPFRVTKLDYMARCKELDTDISCYNSVDKCQMYCDLINNSLTKTDS